MESEGLFFAGADKLFGDRLFTSLERAEPAAGMLLVAAPGMKSAEFARSVLFIIDHDPSGSLAVDITKRSDAPVAEVLEEWAPVVSAPPAVYIGGPVNRNNPICIAVTATGKEVPTHTEEALGGYPVAHRLPNRFAVLNLDTDPTRFEGLLSGARIFAGYAGWEPGQLNDEIERGDWFVTPALPSDVLAPARADVWGDIMRRQPWPLPLYATFPADPREN